MLISDLITTDESGELHLEGSTSMDIKQLCKVFLNNKHRTSVCHQIKDNTTFVYMTSERFEYCQA